MRDNVSKQVMIEDTRSITDLKTSAVRIKARGSILISNIEGAIPSIKEVYVKTIIHQFREFLVRLEQVVKNKKKDLDSKELIKLLYKGIELIIHSICVSAVKIFVKSVIKSLMSKFEIHFNKFRNVNEDTAYNKMMVNGNRPSPAQCDQVVSDGSYEKTF